MKQLKLYLLGTALIALMAACGGNAGHSHEGHEQGAAPTEKTEGAQPQSAKQGKEYTSAYICPMHCKGSGSDQAGTCPVCGMDYVKNEDHGHAH